MFLHRHDAPHGKLKTTIAQFFRISGGSNQNKGVIPDIVFPTAIDIEDHGERSLDNALPWDKVEPARYIKVSAQVKHFGKIRALHENRIKSDKAFKLLLEQLTLVRTSNKKKTTSLKESKRKAERNQLLDMKHELMNELRVVQGLEPLPERDKTVEIDEFEEEDDEDKPHDVLLQESARILHDLIVIPDATATELQALKTEQPQTISNM